MLAVLVSVAACRRHGNTSNAAGDGRDSAAVHSDTVTSAAAARDTVRGIVALVGNDPLTTLVLTTRDRERLILDARTNPAMQSVRNVLGLDIMVRGLRTDERSAGAAPQPLPVFRMAQFTVRAADGYAAYDGIVTRENSTFSLRLADGTRVATPRLPTALQNKIGARVFVAGPLDAPPISYGIIETNQPPI